MTIRILLADDQKLVRYGLCRLFSQRSEFEVVGEAETATETLALAHQLSPQVVLLDPAIADQPPAALVSDLLRCRPQPFVLILTTREDERAALQLLEVGAAGYLLKTIAPNDLLQSLRNLLSGGTPLHPRIARLVLGKLYEPPPPPPPHPALTAREREILELLARGHSNEEIAQALFITKFTVRAHVCNVLRKLKVANRMQAALYFLRQRDEEQRSS